MGRPGRKIGTKRDSVESKRPAGRVKFADHVQSQPTISSTGARDSRPPTASSGVRTGRRLGSQETAFRSSMKPKSSYREQSRNAPLKSHTQPRMELKLSRLNSDSEDELTDRPFNSTTRVNFVPVPGLKVAQLHAQRTQFPCHDFTAGLTHSERLQRQRDRETDRTARKQMELQRSRLSKGEQPLTVKK